MSLKIFNLCCFMIVITLLSNCKKEGSDQAPAQANISYGNKVKAWFESAARINGHTSNISSRSISTKADRRDGEPQWEKTVFFPNGKIYVTPVKLDIGSSSNFYSVYKYLVAATEKNGDEITDGYFFYVTIDTKQTEQPVLDLFKEMLPESFFTMEAIPSGFTGAILKYDLDYRIIGTALYTKGIKTSNVKANFLAKIGEQFHYIDQPGFLDATARAQYKCEDWFQVTFTDEGVIIDVQYIYTECIETGQDGPQTGGGGGSGNTTPTPQPTDQSYCNMSSQEAENALTTITGEEDGSEPHFTEGPESVNAVDGRIRKPNNPVQGLATLHFPPYYYPHYSAFFAGVVYKNNEADRWKWESCVYRGTNLDGGEVPPCIEITPAVNTSKVIFSADGTNAYTQINFTFKIKISCFGPVSPTKTYTGGRLYTFPASQTW